MSRRHAILNPTLKPIQDAPSPQSTFDFVFLAGQPFGVCIDGLAAGFAGPGARGTFSNRKQPVEGYPPLRDEAAGGVDHAGG